MQNSHLAVQQKYQGNDEPIPESKQLAITESGDKAPRINLNTYTESHPKGECQVPIG